MAFKVIRNDLTRVSADAIVNPANPLPVIGKGTDSTIYEAAGKKNLLEARCKIGEIEPGNSVWTNSFNLKKTGIKYIIHTAGVLFTDGTNGKTETLRNCYKTSLSLAKSLGCKSVALPLLGTGNYAFPKELGFQIAVDEITRFVTENEMDVILVVYDKKSYLISEKLFDDVQSFIDENISEPDRLFPEEEIFCEKIQEQIISEKRALRKTRGKPKLLKVKGSVKPDVDFFISQESEKLNFQNTLQKMIAERNLENSAVYNRAFIDRKFFSKIISRKNYIPKKMTVMALGLALELPLMEYESFLASAGYAFMPSSRFDLIIKYCVLNRIYNLVEVDMILDSHGEICFSAD